MSRRVNRSRRGGSSEAGGQESQRRTEVGDRGGKIGGTSFRFYGSYGGPGWTGGRFTGGEDRDEDYRVPPTDGVDAVFRWHDYHYRPGFSRAAADRIASDELWRHEGPAAKAAALALRAQALYREYRGDFWDQVRHDRPSRPSSYMADARAMERSLDSQGQEGLIHVKGRSAEDQTMSLSKVSDPVRKRERVAKVDLRFVASTPVSGSYTGNNFSGIGDWYPDTSVWLAGGNLTNPTYANALTFPGGAWYTAYSFILQRAAWYRFRMGATVYAQHIAGAAPVAGDSVNVQVILELGIDNVPTAICALRNTILYYDGNPGGTFQQAVGDIQGIFYFPGRFAYGHEYRLAVKVRMNGYTTAAGTLLVDANLCNFAMEQCADLTDT